MPLNMCNFHRRGLPVYAKDQRFYEPGCAMCEEKLLAGKVSKSDPTPSEIWKECKGEQRRRIKNIAVGKQARTVIVPFFREG